MHKPDGDADKAARVGGALVDDLKKQMREDMVIWENKVFHERPALADTDGPVMTFRTWAKQFYVDGDPVTEAALRRAGVPSPA